MADVQMQELRRSERLAALEQLKKQIPTVTLEPAKKKVSRRKQKTKSSDDVVMKAVSQVKKSQKGKKTGKSTTPKKLKDRMQLVKLNDVFSLIKKYSVTSDERNTKYSILKAVLSVRKDIGISNTIQDFTKHHSRIIARIVAKGVKVKDALLAYEDVDTHMRCILDYPEFHLLDEHNKNEEIQAMEMDTLDSLVNTMSELGVSETPIDLSDILGKMCII